MCPLYNLNTDRNFAGGSEMSENTLLIDALSRTSLSGVL
jgi:hypothetical protein